ncbi:MAG: hypothetical protein ABS46_17250 [Cytophagaceae bacterium SCN 52-12]|nr:MAG: hypothetical protein ABS46_17250 [Cytophagaceae bacterium SCN 52-12]
MVRTAAPGGINLNDGSGLKNIFDGFFKTCFHLPGKEGHYRIQENCMVPFSGRKNRPNFAA